MGKVLKFADKIKKIKRTADVIFFDDNGEEVSFKLESRSEELIDDVNHKYDALKPQVPTKRLPSANGKFKVIEDHDNAEYRKALGKIQKKNFAELALLFLAEEERPEGTLEEQVEQIQQVEFAGFVAKIVQRGLEISGVIEEESFEDEIEDAKND